MRDVSIIGVGQVPVAEHWEKSLRQIGAEAVRLAVRDARVERVDALYVGNMLAGELTGQEHLGALIAEHAGLRGIEAYRIEAACGSGGAVMRAGVMAVASGAVDVVVVAGVEKMTDEWMSCSRSCLNCEDRLLSTTRRIACMRFVLPVLFSPMMHVTPC